MPNTRRSSAMASTTGIEKRKDHPTDLSDVEVSKKQREDDATPHTGEHTRSPTLDPPTSTTQTSSSTTGTTGQQPEHDTAPAPNPSLPVNPPAHAAPDPSPSTPVHPSAPTIPPSSSTSSTMTANSTTAPASSTARSAVNIDYSIFPRTAIDAAVNTNSSQCLISPDVFEDRPFIPDPLVQRCHGIVKKRVPTAYIYAFSTMPTVLKFGDSDKRFNKTNNLLCDPNTLKPMRGWVLGEADVVLIASKDGTVPSYTTISVVPFRPEDYARFKQFQSAYEYKPLKAPKEDNGSIWALKDNEKDGSGGYKIFDAIYDGEELITQPDKMEHIDHPTSLKSGDIVVVEGTLQRVHDTVATDSNAKDGKSGNYKKNVVYNRPYTNWHIRFGLERIYRLLAVTPSSRLTAQTKDVEYSA
ncbi:hypothetical protein EIP91_001804 [Steccherinum ochraceum]|uniref:Uncharacterized protein n=1 Tax=Steccherinum ochraceum TaxID=92696 RepID=A0A4R0RTN7_9APHY|nr:hypothetical protein EIP91_001804 [Steccherinum ochraceum]